MNLNFRTWFYNDLWLLQGYVNPILKKHWLVNLEFAKIETVQIVDRALGGDKLIIAYFNSTF